MNMDEQRLAKIEKDLAVVITQVTHIDEHNSAVLERLERKVNALHDSSMRWKGATGACMGMGAAAGILLSWLFSLLPMAL